MCLIIRNNLNFSAQQVSLPSEFDCLEILAVDLTEYSSALPFRLVVAYRPPDYANSDNDLFFAALDYLANSSCGRFCLTGDLNLPNFEWELFLHLDNILYYSDFISMAAAMACITLPQTLFALMV
jgi:hypothetical protein